MNDFTKEELINIDEIMAWHGSTPPDFIYDTCENLRAKIQSMIDNFCEHNEIKIEEEKPHMKFTCINCNKIIFEM